MALLKVVSRCSSTSSTTATGTGQIYFQHQSPNSISWKSVENWEKAPTLSRVYAQTTERPGFFYFPSVSLDIIQNIISEFVTAKHDAFILIQLTVTNPVIFSSVCSRGQRDAFRADVGKAGVQFYFILAAGTHRGTHRTQNAWLTLNYDINMSDLLVPLVKHDDLLHDGKQLIWTLGSWLHIWRCHLGYWRPLLCNLGEFKLTRKSVTCWLLWKKMRWFRV